MNRLLEQDKTVFVLIAEQIFLKVQIIANTVKQSFEREIILQRADSFEPAFFPERADSRASLGMTDRFSEAIRY